MSPNYPQPPVTLSLRISIQQRRVVNKLLTLKKKVIEVMRSDGEKPLPVPLVAPVGGQSVRWLAREELIVPCCLGVE